MLAEFKVRLLQSIKVLSNYEFIFEVHLIYHRFWRGLYCRFESGVHPRENLEEIVLATADQNSSLDDHINFLHKVLIEIFSYI